MSLVNALRMARALGWGVRPLRATGEVLVVCPGFRPIRLNGRKKDAQRRLTVLLRKFHAMSPDRGAA
jgi:hypothetical protein